MVSFDQFNNTGAIDKKMDGSVPEEKSSFKMLGLTFSSKLDWGFYIISIAKSASKKIGALICSIKILSPEAAVYLYKFSLHPCMEYCCYVWTGAPSCNLELLDKLQKQICWTIAPSLTASLEPFANSYSDMLHDFQQAVFHTQNIFFQDTWKFIIIQKFNSHQRQSL